tara:strand:+ start:12750 stop:13910 length:1161 start_codon:yes stop_codon:yes gene_type:complete
MQLLKVDINPNRVYGLDILRALSIILIVYSHGSYMLSSLAPLWMLNLPVVDPVTMFFVLSGFLIGGILIKTLETKPVNRHTLLNFWTRRWFRTLPNYYLVLTFLVTYHMLFEDLELASVASYFLFLQNFAWDHPAFFPEAWTLAIEEWFYLLVPISLFSTVGLGVKPRNAVLGVIVAVIIGSIAVRWGRFYSMESVDFMQWDAYFRQQVITRLDSLIFGVLGAWLYYYYADFWYRMRKHAFLLGVAMLLLYKASFVLLFATNLQIGVYHCVFSFTLVSCGIFLLLPLLSHLRQGSGFLYRTLTMFSLVSYSMYLLHFAVVQYIAIPRFLELVPIGLQGESLALFKFGLYWLFNIVGSILLYKYFEIPTTEMRNSLSVGKLKVAGPR